MNKKEKGFTLIELLAVIVILAIILLIAIPIVSNVIEESRVGAFKVSASNISRSAEYTYMNNMMKEGQGERLEFYYGEKEETSNKANYKLNYKGDKPDFGVVFVNKKGETSVTLYNSKYKLCATKAYSENEVKVTRNVTRESCDENISNLQLELINGKTFSLEIELGENYILSTNDYIAYNLEGERSTNVEIYVDGIKENVINRSILNKEYKVIYKLIDDNEPELILEKEQTIKIVDTTPPIIEVPENTELKTSEVLSYNLREGVTVTDNSGENLEFEVLSGLSRTPGSHQIKYIAEDSSGNKAEVIRIIDVVDDEAPVITLNGSNPMNINVGSIYTEPGATAIDEVDGNLTSSIAISGNVNTNVVGTYYITYKVSDSEGNEAVTTREIRVIDNIAPTVVFVPNGNSTYGKTYNTKVTVNDNVGVNTSSLKYIWNTSTSAPSESSFTTSFTNGVTLATSPDVTGDYYLWILAKDTAGNRAIVRSNVFKLDNTLPVITNIVSGASNITDVSFTITRSGNASDAHSGLSTNPYIYQTSTNGSTWTTKCTNNNTSCNVIGLSAETTYYYRICVIDEVGNQNCTTNKTAKTTLPMYYYDKYEVKTENKYYMKRIDGKEVNEFNYWSWGGPDDPYLSDVITGYKNYSFDENTGRFSGVGTLYSGTGSKSALADGTKLEDLILYYITGSYNSVLYVKDDYRDYGNGHGIVYLKFYKSELTTVYKSGTYIARVTGTANQYPVDGRHSDGYWYIRRTKVN